MKNSLIIIIFSILFLGACSPRRVIEEKEKIVYVDKVIRDSIFTEKIITKNDTIENEIIIDCDSTSLYQKFKDGGSNVQIVKDKGKVVVKYQKLPAEIVYEKVYIEKSEKKDSIVSDTSSKTIVEKPSFWDNLKTHFYKISFFIILILWVLGVTPLKIFSWVKKVV